jgi:hypothetical protein
MKKIELTSMGSLCSLSYTKNNELNGIQIESSDFGEKYDDEPHNAEDYGCGNMKFFPSPSTDEVLEKYGITEEEYSLVCDQLEDVLSFGGCGWCI